MRQSDPGSHMRRIIEEQIERLRNGSIDCIIPQRTGLRKMRDGLIFHEHPEIFIQVHGTNRFFFPAGTVDIGPGSILVVPPELPHGERALEEDGRFDNLVITPHRDLLQCHLSTARIIPGSTVKVPVIGYLEKKVDQPPVEVISYCTSLIEAGAYRDSHSDDIIRGLLLSLLSAVRRSLDTRLPLPDENPLVREVRHIVLSRYQYRDLSVASIADQLQRTPDYISWLFHKHSGQSLKRHINSVRLDRAVDMLKNTDYNISEIAWNCGYGSPAYFSRIFSQNYDKSPRDYRARLAGGR